MIEHEEIAGLMPAMTMSFDVPIRALLASLGRGPDDRLPRRARRATSYRVIEAHRAPARPAAPAPSGGFCGARARGDPAPDFALVDQDGAPLTLADLRGKLVAARLHLHQLPGSVSDPDRART